MNLTDANPQASQRIVLVTSLGYGGATVYALNLARGLLGLGIPVLIVSPDKDHPFATDFDRYGIPVVVTDQRKLIYEDQITLMLKAISEFKPTAVLGCLGPISYEILRYLKPGVLRMALVHTDHSIFYDAVKPYAPWIDIIFGVSQSITKKLGNIDGFRQTPRFQLPCGVEIPNASRSEPSSHDPIRIIYLGRLVEPQKRVRLFPEILDHLKASGIPFIWSIAGEGPELEFLKETMTSTHEQQKIQFLGSIPNTLVPDILHEQDIYLLASDAEGLPVSLLEAMASGVVPVTSYLESGLSELVNETTGIAIPPMNTAGYAEAIIHLAHNRSELRDKSLRCIYEIRKRHSLSASATELMVACPASDGALGSSSCDFTIMLPLGTRLQWKFLPPLRWLRRAWKIL